MDILGDKIPGVARKGLLDLLKENHPQDTLTCLEFFVQKDLRVLLLSKEDDDAINAASLAAQLTDSLNQIVDGAEWRRIAQNCIESLPRSPTEKIYSLLVGALEKSFEHRDEPLVEKLVEARFRSLASQSLEDENALVDGGAQILCDAAMAGKWALCRQVSDQFGLNEENSSSTLLFAKKEQSIALDPDGFASASDDVWALADLAFNEHEDAGRSIKLLEMAVSEAKESSDNEEAVSFLSRVLIIASGYQITTQTALRVSRQFPEEPGLLEKFVACECRILEVVSGLKDLSDLDDVIESLTVEFSQLYNIVSPKVPLITFLRYLQFLKQLVQPESVAIDSLMAKSPEDFMAYLVAEKQDEAAAESLSKMLGIKIVDALISRSTAPITIRELEYIARSDPMLAASVAVQRQGPKYNEKLLDFAEASIDNTSLASASVHRVIDSSRLFGRAFGSEEERDKHSSVWTLLLDGDVQGYHEQIVAELQNRGDFEQALRIADDYLVDGPNDQLLAGMARKGGPQCWRFISRILDRNLASGLTLSLLFDLDLQHAKDLLAMAMESDRANVAAEAAVKHKLLIAYEPVLLHKNVFGPWSSWQELDRACQEDCEKVVRLLMEWKQFDLAKVVTESFVDPMSRAQSSLNIDADALVHLLEHGSDAESVSAFLKTVSDPVATVRATLAVFKVPDARVLLWQYLVDEHSNVVTSEDRNHLLGAKALSLLPIDDAGGTGSGGAASLRAQSRARRGLFASTEGSVSTSSSTSDLPTAEGASIESAAAGPSRVDLRRALFRLEGSAENIVETLLMNERIAEAKVILRGLPELVRDECIMTYARKALAFDKDSDNNVQGVSGNAASPAVSKGGLAWIMDSPLAGVDWMAMQRRHFYKAAPSISLSTSLLDLCSEPRCAGRACLDISLHLTSLLASSTLSNQLLLLNLVKQLLVYAQLQFTKQANDRYDTVERPHAVQVENQSAHCFLVDDRGGAEGGVAVCQTFLARVDLLHDLQLESCNIVCSLEDLADARKARVVRDKLVDLDRMKMATALSTKCAIETEPVWLAWGLRLLRLGDYEAAKDKLNKCIESSDRGAKFGVAFDRSAMLVQILEILQSGTHESLGDSSALRDDLHAMEDALKASGDPESFVFPATARSLGPPKLDTVRYMQCVYYLSRIGTPVQLIRFWLSNGFLEDACRYIIMRGLPEEFFINEILTHCLSFNTMPALYASLRRIDPQGSQKTPYLVQTCRYLNEAHAWDLLLEMQEFMGDWCRAGQTCVKLFHIESDLAVRVKYLKLAEGFFANAIKAAQQSRLKKAASFSRVSDAVTPGGVVDDFSPGSAPLSENEINKFHRKVVLQGSILEFLQQRPTISETEELRKLSMFGSSKDRIAERLVVLAPASDLGFRMMQEFRLPQGEIYSRAVRELVTSKRKSELAALLKTVKGAIDADEWDMVLLSIIKAYAEDMKDSSAAEKYISKIYSSKSQMISYRLVGKLKTAYILAAKVQDLEQVKQVRAAALESGSKNVVALCNSFLAKGSRKE